MTNKLILANGTPSIWRRCFAILYDALLIFSCIILWAFIMVALNKGQAITEKNIIFLWTFRLGAVFIWFLFMTYFTSNQRQTLGMRAWRLIVVNQSGAKLTFKEASFRTLCIILTSILGLLWIIFDNKKQALYDRLSNCQMLQVVENPYISKTK